MTTKTYECPICNANTPTEGTLGTILISCRVCGEYRLDGILYGDVNTSFLKTEIERKKLSHKVKWACKQDDSFVLTTETLEAFLKMSCPEPGEQFNNIILWFGESSKQVFGTRIDFISDELYSISGAGCKEALFCIFNLLKTDGYIEGEITRDIQNNRRKNSWIQLTRKGWEHYKYFLKTGKGSRKVFVAMQFNPGVRGFFLKHFKQSIEQTGFEFKLIDQNAPAGSIDNRIRVEIRTSRFVIADLTNGNPGAYWEAGFAEGLGKPVIYTCEEKYFGEKGTHFDTRNLLTIKWNEENPEEAITNLKATIRATLPDEAKMED